VAGGAVAMIFQLTLLDIVSGHRRCLRNGTQACQDSPRATERCEREHFADRVSARQQCAPTSAFAAKMEAAPESAARSFRDRTGSCCRQSNTSRLAMPARPRCGPDSRPRLARGLPPHWSR
jgi:hypothetical protein